MEERILKTDYWKREKQTKDGILKTRMSEEIAKNISNNLIIQKENNRNSNSLEVPNKDINNNQYESLFVKSREISFNNTFTHHTLGSEGMNSTGKYTSFGDLVSRTHPNSFLREKNFIGYSKEGKNNAWSKNSKKESYSNKNKNNPKLKNTKHHRISRDDSAKENVNILNSNIIRSNFTLNPELEYDNKKTNKELARVTEEPSDYSSIMTNDRPNVSKKSLINHVKETKNYPEASTVSSTVHSKIGLHSDNPFNQKTRRFSNSLKDFEDKKNFISANQEHEKSSKGKLNEEYYKDFGQKIKDNYPHFEETHRKTQSKNYNKSNLVKNLILNRVSGTRNEPIQVYNIEVKPIGQKTLPKTKEDKPKPAQNRKKRKRRNRGEISSIEAIKFQTEMVDKGSIEMPNIRLQMKKMGLANLKTKCQSEVVTKDSALTKRAVKTEKLGFDSRGFGFSKRNLISIEGESRLENLMDETNLSRHNKFIKNSRKQRSNIKINFGQSLTPKKKVISKNKAKGRVERKSKTIGGKKLFETMEDRGINEEVKKRMQNSKQTGKVKPRYRKSPVIIRNHDDMMKKSVDFINGIENNSTNEAQGSLIESILKKKEISNVSLDYSGM